MTNSIDNHSLPKPKTRDRGALGKLIALTVCAVLVAAGMAYWVTRDDDERKKITNQASDIIKKSPVGDVMQYVASPAPTNEQTPPAYITNPTTQPGTLAGQVVQGEIVLPPTGTTATGATQRSANATTPAGATTSASGGSEAADGAVNANGTGADSAGTAQPDATNIPPAGYTLTSPRVQEDSVVQRTFLDDAAQWLVGRYIAGKKNLSVSALNARYGNKLYGLQHQSKDVYAGRASVLRYIFNEPMLQALYGLYADDFVQAMTKAAAHPAKGIPLTTAQTAEMLDNYAGQFVALGAVMQGLASITNLPAQLADIRRLGQQATNTHTKVREAVFVLDDAREANNTTAATAAQLRVDGLNAQYQRLIHDRDMAKDKLVQAVRRTSPATQRVDADTIFFIASWLERRGEDVQPVQTSVTAAKLMDDLAVRMRQAKVDAEPAE